MLKVTKALYNCSMTKSAPVLQSSDCEGQHAIFLLNHLLHLNLQFIELVTKNTKVWLHLYLSQSITIQMRICHPVITKADNFIFIHITL